MLQVVLSCLEKHLWSYIQVKTSCVLLQVAPAMNTFMWDSPFTGEHLNKLQNLGAQVIAPISKSLACGDIGVGAMAEPEHIANLVLTHTASHTET